MTGMELAVWNTTVYWTTFFTIQGAVLSMIVAQKVYEDRLKTQRENKNGEK